MGVALGIAALSVSFASAILGYLAWTASKRSATAADRSATAAESADRRARQPRLSIWLDHPTPAPGELVIYQVRNDGPQDLTSFAIYRPQLPDGKIFPLAVTGDPAGWAKNEIEVGPLAVTREAKFTFCCGAAGELPEFRVGIECKSGPETWLVSQVLPPPRGEPVSEKERDRRREVLFSALNDIERNIRTVEGKNWRTIELPDDALSEAHRLLHQHAPDWIGPVRDALDGRDDFLVWREEVRGVFPRGNDFVGERDAFLARLGSALNEVRTVMAALEPGQTTGRAWRS